MLWTSDSLAFVPVTIVDDMRETSEEQLGTKDKFWFEDLDGSRWLFKWCRERDQIVRGEDWAEVLVALVGGHLGVPTAEVRLATSNGRRGIVSKEVLKPQDGDRLVLGNSLLSQNDVSYDPTAKRENQRYTVEAVAEVLADVSPPRDFQAVPAIQGAFDVWVGYLVLDALVAGRDRHHENWGVVSDGRGRSLAPSFDHGNALGFQEHGSNLARLTTRPDVRQRWAERGASHHFRGRPGLVELASYALQRSSAGVREHWLNKIDEFDVAEMEFLTGRVPAERMSADARSFVLQVLDLNKRRILDGC